MITVNHLTNNRLKQECEENNAVYKKDKEESNGRFCYELIRRAVYHIENASDLVYDIYFPWLLRKLIALNKQVIPELNDLTQEAFVKFFTYVTPETWPKFKSLGHVLAYLGKCGESALYSYWRKLSKRKKMVQAFPEDKDIVHTGDSDRPIEENIAKKEFRHQLWDCVRRNCSDAKDRFLVKQLWQYGRKPKEVAEHFPEMFPQPVDIYKRKRNLVDRIKNDSCSSLLNYAIS